MHAGRLVARALGQAEVAARLHGAAAVDVIAAGKASGVMLAAFAERSPVRPRTLLGVGPSRPDHLPANAEWQNARHPLPDEGSLAGARRALAIAASAAERELLVVLLSGGGSALMALPVADVPLADKQEAARLLMTHNADIHGLNTVRKHLSAVKGGQLAAASRGHVLTLAVSDVVGDDLSVIASGPTVPDDSTFGEALDVLARHGGVPLYPASVVRHLRRGAAGEVPETPTSSDARLSRSAARVIGPQRGAIDSARVAAEALGYHVHVVDAPVVGEARLAAAAHIRQVAAARASLPRPLCVISSGETTVNVVGRGRGGRNQEFALAMAPLLSTLGGDVAAASIGTDGIDGPTDAAGAVVDSTTLSRARVAGLDPEAYLGDNDTYAFFDALGDLVRSGPTSTNVGDLQVVLLAGAGPRP